MQTFNSKHNDLFCEILYYSIIQFLEPWNGLLQNNKRCRNIRNLNEIPIQDGNIFSFSGTNLFFHYRQQVAIRKIENQKVFRIIDSFLFLYPNNISVYSSVNSVSVQRCSYYLGQIEQYQTIYSAQIDAIMRVKVES